MSDKAKRKAVNRATYYFSTAHTENIIYWAFLTRTIHDYKCVFCDFTCIFYRALAMHYIYCVKTHKGNEMFTYPGVLEWNLLLLDKIFTVLKN